VRDQVVDLVGRQREPMAALASSIAARPREATGTVASGRGS